MPQFLGYPVMPRLVIALVAVVIVAGVGTLTGAPQGVQSPISMAWPFALELGPAGTPQEGEARFQVRIDRGVVVAVEPRSGPLGFVSSAKQTLETWRLGPDWDGSWEVAVRHVLEGENGCEDDLNQIIRATVPTLVSVTSKKSITICDPSRETVTFLKPFAEIAGVITCQCPGNILAGTELLLTSRGFRRTVRSDLDGGFRFSGLMPGEYRLRFLAEAYSRTDYRFTVATDGRKDPVELEAVADPIRRVDTLVVGGSIPTYPAQALERGVAGSVDLRLSMRQDEVIDVDAKGDTSELAAATSAVVRTWRFQSTVVPVLKIKFTYRLAAGNCEITPQSTVEMRLPSNVVIESHRKCPASR